MRETWDGVSFAKHDRIFDINVDILTISAAVDELFYTIYSKA